MNIINYEVYSLLIIIIITIDYQIKNKMNWNFNKHLFFILAISISSLSLFNIVFNIFTFDLNILKYIIGLSYILGFIPSIIIAIYNKYNFLNKYNIKEIITQSITSILVYSIVIIFYLNTINFNNIAVPHHILDFQYLKIIFLFSLVPLVISLIEFIYTLSQKRSANKYSFLMFFSLIIPIIGITLDLCLMKVIFVVPSYVLSFLSIYIYRNNMNIFIDPLTQLYNRKIFEIETFTKRYKKRHMFACYIDVDDFKYINDTYGHSVGDLILKDVSDILRTSVRKTDYVIRMGGDEFLIIVGIKEKKDKSIVLNRIDNGVNDYNEKHDIKISLSIGSDFNDNRNLEEFINAIDKKMYENKKDKKSKINNRKK